MGANSKSSGGELYCGGNTAPTVADIDKETMVDILRDYVFPSRDWYSIDARNFKFQQDNASVHTAKIVKDYIKRSRIPIIAWPPNSPDLNPIETVWAYIKDQLSKYPNDPKDEDKLWERVQDIWNKIP